jgi:cold-inducible RNA-binding protein
LAVRLFVGNLPYSATEADIRSHFAAVADPSHIVLPTDRETGRPRGFAFVEFAEREMAEEAIRRFDGQPFLGRPLAVSEARAREDRPPGGFAPRSGGFAPRPPGGFTPRGPGGVEPPGAPGSRDRNFGPPAPPKRQRGPARGQKKEGGPKGPIRERAGGRFSAFDLDEDDVGVEFDDIATSAGAGEADTHEEDEE